MPNEKLRCFSSPFIWFCFSLIFFFEECPVELGISKLSNSFLETFADLGRFRGLNHIGKKSLSVFLICSWFITYLDMTLYSQYIYICLCLYIYIQDCSNVRFFCRSPTLNLFGFKKNPSKSNPRPWLQLPGEEGSGGWRFLTPAKHKKRKVVNNCEERKNLENLFRDVVYFVPIFRKFPKKFFASCIFGFKQFRLYSKSIPLLVLRSSCPHHLNRSWVTISIEVTFHHSTSEAQKNVSQWNLKSWIWNKVNLNSLKKSPKV